MPPFSGVGLLLSTRMTGGEKSPQLFPVRVHAMIRILLVFYLKLLGLRLPVPRRQKVKEPMSEGLLQLPHAT